MDISVIGLGKLGSPLAAVLAAKGHTVVGVDRSAEAVRLLDAGIAPVQEPDLQELLDRSGGRLTATTDLRAAILATDVSYIIVPTPSDETGRFTNRYVLDVIDELGAALRDKPGRHVVNVTSTVMPGSTGGPIREALERTSARTVGRDVGLCYSPEFIALGSVVHDMLHPDVVLIGESDAVSGAIVEDVALSMAESSPAVQRMNIVNAELVKIATNTYVTNKISFANMLADVCERLPGGDVDVVTRAVGADSRVGGKYLKGGAAFGGPCFPRDSIAFARLAEDLGTTAELADATRAVNARQSDRIVGIVERHVGPGATVAVLGLAYKPNTGVIEESPGIAIATALASHGYRVRGHDPLAGVAATEALSAVGATVVADAEDAIERADAVVVTMPMAEYEALASQLGHRPVVVVDIWRHLDPDAIGPLADIVVPGRGPVDTIDSLVEA